jgi:flap endonuclease-1
MGVNGFFKILATHNIGKRPKNKEDAKTIEQLGKLTTLNSLAGKCVCIDATYMIYNSILAMSSVHALTDSRGNPTAHINTIFAKVIQLATADVKQLWIFDSPNPNEFKRTAYEKRAERRKQAAEKEYKNNEKVQFSIKSSYIRQIQKLLSAMGISYVVAPDGVEAEQYGAYLTKGTHRFCEYVITGDSDVLCFGGNLLRIRHVKTSTGGKKTEFQAYQLQELLDHLQLTYEDFLKVCVLCGTDFAEGESGTGPRTVVAKVRSGEYYISPRQELVMSYFASDIADKIGSADIVRGELDEEKVVKLLVKKKKFDENRIRKSLEKFKKAMTE